MNDWSRFGRGDRRGALSLIDPAAIIAACRAVSKGQVISLNAPVEGLQPSPTGRPALRRTVRQHNQLRPVGDGTFVVVNDDIVEFALQGSSQWDTFAHFGVIEEGSPDVFYGGAGLDETYPDPIAKSLGIDIFEGGLAARGVLLDIVGTIAGLEADTMEPGTAITRAVVEDTIARQNVTMQRGDVAVVYTGFYGAVRSNGGPLLDQHSGLVADTIPLWEELEVSAIAADSPGVEIVDLRGPGPVSDMAIHRHVMRDLGIVLGELWALDELVRASRADSRYDFLLVSAPLNIPGAFGSPANALAIR